MLDHVIYGAPDLDEAVDVLEKLLGVRPSAGGHHVGLGTHNALLDLNNDTYLEVIAPDPSQSKPARPRAFALDKLVRPRLINWAAKATDLEARVAAAKTAGFDAGPVNDMSRAKPDGDLLEWRLSQRPQGPGGDGLVPFLIDWGDAAHPARTAAHGCTLVGWRGEHPDPVTIQHWLTALDIDLDVTQADTPALIASIETPNGLVELR